jgi:hypothetical protein
LHRRRSVVVVLNEDGKRVSWSRIDNTPANLAGEIVPPRRRRGGVDDVGDWAADVIASVGRRCVWRIR